MAATVDYAALKKGGFMRQKQKGYFSLRLQVVGGNLTAENIKTVSEVAEKYGQGYVHMTSRQGIEIPFIKFEDIEEVKAELAKGGVNPGVCGPRVRTVTACQGGAICPSGCIDTYELAKELNERYFGRELPHKFKFGVTGCQNNCLKAEENDLGIKGGMVVTYDKPACINCGVCVKACREGALTASEDGILLDAEKCNNCGRCVKSCPVDAWKGESGYIVSFGGLFGNKIYKGETIVPIIKDKETLFRVADAAIKFFEDNAKAGERFRFTLQRVGEEKFEQVIKAAAAGEESVF
ncbi:MAG: 4Fe-4S binding protein [Lachnospiraceae bacterium]|nr:4Fe-4S binding protein [Lachnospiraceae bacterium]